MTSRLPTVLTRGRALIDRNPPMLVWVVLIVSVVVTLMVVHVIAALRDVQTWTFFLDHDRSYGEFFEYIQVGWSILLLGLIAYRIRRRHPLAWVPLFALMLADNFWILHERIGAWLLQPGMPPGFAEPLFGALYLAALVPVFLAARKEPMGWMRTLHRRLGVCFVLLLAFGVGVDTVHVAVRGDSLLDPLLGFVEDGGELATTSAILLSCLSAWYRAPGPGEAVSSASADSRL